MKFYSLERIVTIMRLVLISVRRGIRRYAADRLDAVPEERLMRRTHKEKYRDAKAAAVWAVTYVVVQVVFSVTGPIRYASGMMMGDLYC